MKKLFFLSLIALLLPACSHEAAKSPATPVAEASPPAPLNITTAVVEERPMPRYLRFTGELKGERQAMLAPDVAGKVVSAPIERGSIVKAGEVILRLDDRSSSLALQEAEASLADAKLKSQWAQDELKRNETLVKTSAISALEFERLKLNQASSVSTLAAATARRDSAKKALGDTVLLAPFTGTVVERLIDVGEYITSSTKVARLVATERLRLVVNVPETNVGSIRVGQAVSFMVPAFPDANFEGTVQFLGAALRETARDLAVEAEVINKDGRLKPGMFAEGRLVLAEEPCVTVPSKALRVDGKTHKIFVVHDGIVDERIVEVGETKGDSVEIRQGVTLGESVVLAPGAEATDGMKVAQAAQL